MSPAVLDIEAIGTVVVYLAIGTTKILLSAVIVGVGG